MSAKQGPLNQHEYLHPYYGVDNCCLCKAETRIKVLEEELRKHRELVKDLNRYRVDHTIKNQVDIDPEIIKLIDKNFWSLV